MVAIHLEQLTPFDQWIHVSSKSQVSLGNICTYVAIDDYFKYGA